MVESRSPKPKVVGSSPAIRADKIKMNKVKNFILESVDEMKNKVTWSSSAELQNNTILVLIASLIFALLIGVMDTVFKKIMEVIYNL